MRRLIFALAGCIASAEASAADHVVLHGLSWHSGERIEQQTTSREVVTAVMCDMRTCDGIKTATVYETRDVVVPYNETNYGIGWRRTYGPTWAAQAGLYLNSYDKLSVYGLGEWTPLHYGALSAGLFAGLASGYSHGFTAGGFVARWQGDRLGVAVRYMPDVSEKVRGSVTTVEASWRIGG